MRTARSGAATTSFCASMEHKLGIHASPTCTMVYGDGFVEGEEAGAIGWLVGEENRGLACMFTMMNNARLAVGIQGVAVAEAAFQRALAYAIDRRQGKASSYNGRGHGADRASPRRAARPPDHEGADPHRPLDLLRHRTCDRHGKGLGGRAAASLAGAGQSADPPSPKAFSTDIGVEVASLGVQVHGGMGYVEETGAASLYRDARIAPIYEGTNGIQAIDLVTRKLPQSGGDHIKGYIGELRADIDAVRSSNREGLGATADRCAAALDALDEATGHLQKALAEGRMEQALAGGHALSAPLRAGRWRCLSGAGSTGRRG